MNSAKCGGVTTHNIAEMSNEDINILIERHLFRSKKWCAGRLEYHYACASTHAGHGTGTAYWQCDECGAIIRDTVNRQHSRTVPDYCRNMSLAWRIVEKLKTLDDLTRMHFELCMMPLYHCCIIAISPRMIAVAALQALNVVDLAGCVIGKCEGTQ